MIIDPEYDSGARLHKPVVLIIDDEVDIFYLLSNILKDFNIRFVPAETIKDGLELINSMPGVFLVFLDNHLSDGLGIEYIKIIKERADISVVMMTAYDTRYHRKLAEEKRADGFIGKLFSKMQITKAINDACVTRSYCEFNIIVKVVPRPSVLSILITPL